MCLIAGPAARTYQREHKVLNAWSSERRGEVLGARYKYSHSLTTACDRGCVKTL